jgi:hypothetical protein
MPVQHSAAEFRAVSGNLHHAHDLTVLLAEEHHRAHLAGFVLRLEVDPHLLVAEDLRVHDLLHALDLFEREGPVMGEVEAKPVRLHHGAALHHMGAEDLP